jgi:hypothetical protein
MNIEVRTSEYEFAYCQKPRGTGNWAFFMGRNTNDVSKAHFFYGKYSDAKRKALAKAQELGVGIITVGS